MNPFGQAAVVVRQHDRVLLTSYEGFADRSTNEPISGRTRFQIASISKSFTAMAILMLVEEGGLSLHDPIGRWMTTSPPAWERITIHRLLTHTSGLGHWPFYPELDLMHPIDPAAVLAIFRSRPLISEPGDRYAYSSPGYVLLAHLVEQAAAAPYRTVLDERILRPMAMRDTIVGNASSQPMLAHGYERGEPAQPFELDTVGRGAGDIWSTASELAEWMGSLPHQSLLSKPMHELMLRPHVDVAGGDAANPVPVTHYGYGLSFTEQDGEPLILHTGHNPGFRAVAGLLPSRNVSFAYLSNEETADLGAVMAALRPIITAPG